MLLPLPHHDHLPRACHLQRRNRQRRGRQWMCGLAPLRLEAAHHRVRRRARNGTRMLLPRSYCKTESSWHCFRRTTSKTFATACWVRLALFQLGSKKNWMLHIRSAAPRCHMQRTSARCVSALFRCSEPRTPHARPLRFFGGVCNKTRTSGEQTTGGAGLLGVLGDGKNGQGPNLRAW